MKNKQNLHSNYTVAISGAMVCFRATNTWPRFMFSPDVCVPNLSTSSFSPSPLLLAPPFLFFFLFLCSRCFVDKGGKHGSQGYLGRDLMMRLYRMGMTTHGSFGRCLFC
ncbi:hypothetical protein BC939DRAFT_451348 [Gamsiella multidivaricata]|uniref:uncharacterized protein n=1 Tax=Gamsiella multidivaricata TaxID=101098 RepID=UPI002220B787|nr:uncharacterized protein BC939DRAFT_451348 [Gamsiella multidivaricata]KAI7823556.1 hypothetical protein BC939DRAFT_451348 [Gamsiella multidivaricata]